MPAVGEKTMPAHAAEQRSDLSVPNWTQASDEKVLSRGGW